MTRTRRRSVAGIACLATEEMTDHDAMEIRERRASGVAVLDVIGRMVLTDGASDNVLRDRVVELLAQGHQHVVLNVSQVTQIDTSGLKQLLAAHFAMTRRGGHLRVACPTARIRNVLTITRLNSLFELFDAEPAAIDGIVPDLGL